GEEPVALDPLAAADRRRDGADGAGRSRLRRVAVQRHRRARTLGLRPRPDLAGLLRRRRDRDGAVQRDQPHRAAGRRDPRQHQTGGGRQRGRELLREPRRLPARHPAGRGEQRDGRGPSGGSTITMQYVERYYTGTETSYVGKAKEAIMALKIDQELPKDEILSRYLNTIYFGRGAYGVQEASQAYFGKDASELTDAEAALLVAVIPSPSSYDPANDLERSTTLWDRVITRQVAVDQMTPAEADALEFPETIEPRSENSLGGDEGYLLMEGRKELLDLCFTEEEINTGGFTIVSTSDPGTQENTVQAVENLPDDRPDGNRLGTMTLDP